jgi:hypothetical protein
VKEKTMPDIDESDAPKLRATYDQLCDSYRAIDDFRAKLLGFLPVVTGGGLVVLVGRGEEFAREFFLPMGIFGLAVTAALFSYEIFGIRKCHDLIILGRQLEDLLGYSGQFTVRRKLVGRVINEPFAAGIIYPAVMAAWIYLALFYTARLLGVMISIAIFLLGFTLTFKYDLRLGRYPNVPKASWGQSVPSEPGFYLSPVGKNPISPVVPAENCRPQEGARLRFDLVPLWVLACYRLPFIDRYACAWLYQYGPWEIPIRRPETPAGHAGTRTNTSSG